MRKDSKIALAWLTITRNIPLFSVCNLCMVAYLFVSKTGFQWWFIPGICAILMLMCFNMLYIWKREVTAIFGKSKDIQEIREFLSRLEGKLDRLEGKFGDDVPRKKVR